MTTDARHCDKTAEISRKHGNTLIRTIRTGTSKSACCSSISKTHTERLIQTCNQHLVVERFGKKTGRASRKRLCTRFYFRKSGQENDRQMMTLGNQFKCPAFARH